MAEGVFDRGARVCVIGAGPCGIAAAKALLDEGYTELTVFDAGRDVGGNWVFDEQGGHSSVFETTHIISSKAFSQYDDYAMPERYPDYPSHRLLAEYFQGYSRQFGLYPYIRFETTVERCEPQAGGGWCVRSRGPEGSAEQRFDVLVVANGHHWKPRWPDYPGELSCTYLHSHDFKRAAPFTGQRVLVIGGGNSACDIAVETARVAARTDLSWRRGYWIVPKFMFGMPGDQLHNFFAEWFGFVPTRWRLRGMEALLNLINGHNRRYGLPAPDHRLGETHPTLNSELPYFIRHGEICPRADVERYEGASVRFRDGWVCEYDAVIACTGFQIAHPFLDPAIVDFSHGPVPLYLRMIPEDRVDLYFVGLFQPLGCIWPQAALQAKIMARRMSGAWSPPEDLSAAIAREVARPDVAQIDTPRHTIEVDGPLFRKRLLAQLPRDFVRPEPAPLLAATGDEGTSPAG